MDNQTSPYDIEDLRRQWQAVNLRVDDLERRNRQLTSELSRHKAVGLRQRLMRYRMRSTLICLALPLILAPVLINLHGTSWLFLVTYMLFFWIMAGSNFMIWRSLSRIDISSATTGEAILNVYNVHRYIRFGRVLGWSLAVPLLVWMFSIFYDVGDSGMIWGGWAGLLVGLAIGFCVDYRQRKMLRQLRLEIELACTDQASE